MIGIGPRDRERVELHSVRCVGCVELALLLGEELADRPIPRGSLTDGAVVRHALERRGAHEPPGIASTSTLKLFEARNSASSLGTTGRSFTTVSPFVLPASGPDDHACGVQRQLGRIEEEHLADLRVERVDAQRPRGVGSRALVDGELELDAVGVFDQAQDRLEVFVREFGGPGILIPSADGNYLTRHASLAS